jgi:hypothetical protein
VCQQTITTMQSAFMQFIIPLIKPPSWPLHHAVRPAPPLPPLLPQAQLAQPAAAAALEAPAASVAPMEHEWHPVCSDLVDTAEVSVPAPTREPVSPATAALRAVVSGATRAVKAAKSVGKKVQRSWAAIGLTRKGNRTTQGNAVVNGRRRAQRLKVDTTALNASGTEKNEPAQEPESPDVIDLTGDD